jgi:hypothetical protein
LEASLPLDAVRFALARRPPGKGPERIQLASADPAVRVYLTVDLYGTKLDVGVCVLIESIIGDSDRLEVAIRVRDLQIAAPQGSPAAQLVAAMDLTRPANLLKMMPQKHVGLLEVEGDRIAVNLLRIAALGKNEALRRVLTALSFVRVSAVRAEADMLRVGFSFDPRTLPSSLARLLGIV